MAEEHCELWVERAASNEFDLLMSRSDAEAKATCTMCEGCENRTCEARQETSVKALSVKQPWANFIASAQKTIETRSWGTPYRGDLLIASFKTPAKPGPAGCGVALVELFDCRRMLPSDEESALCEVYPGAYAWRLRNLRPLEPFPIRGEQGLYDAVVPEGGFVLLKQTGLYDNTICEPDWPPAGHKKISDSGLPEIQEEMF